MSKDSKAPQAFPYSGVGDDLNYSKGMTLRDYFAAKAMQGMVDGHWPDSIEMPEIAKRSWLMADAMIEKR